MFAEGRTTNTKRRKKKEKRFFNNYNLIFLLVPSFVVLLFSIFVQFYPEKFEYFNFFKMTGKKEGRLSPNDPNSYARPGKSFDSVLSSGKGLTNNFVLF